MKPIPFITLATLILAGGCVTPPEHGDAKVKGPRGGIAFHVQVETSPPGSRIEVNDDFAGVSPANVIVWGDADGSFHNIGQRYYVIRAYPTGPDQYVQTKTFATGWRGKEDLVPKRIFFDLSVPPTASVNPNYQPPPVDRPARLSSPKK